MRFVLVLAEKLPDDLHPRRAARLAGRWQLAEALEAARRDLEPDRIALGAV